MKSLMVLDGADGASRLRHSQMGMSLWHLADIHACCEQRLL
jgi:hypothetical protein